MASKNISIKEEVYNRLMQLKRDGESFSDLFIRLIEGQKYNLKEYFGAWDLSEIEKNEIWNDITRRPGRKWNRKLEGEQ